MGDVQKTIADLFGLESFKGGCPTSQDVSDEVGRASGGLLELGMAFSYIKGKKILKTKAEKALLKLVDKSISII